MTTLMRTLASSSGLTLSFALFNPELYWRSRMVGIATEANPNARTENPAIVAINLHKNKDFYVVGDTISGDVTVQGLYNHVDSKVVISLECNETSTLVNIGSERTRHFRCLITSTIPKRSRWNSSNSSFTTPYEFVLDNEIVGLPPSSSLDSLGVVGTGIWWEVRSWVQKSKEGNLEANAGFESISVEVYPCVPGLKELVNNQRRVGLMGKHELLHIHMVDMPLWLPQAPDRFSWAVFIDTKKPVYVHSIIAFLLKTVIVSVNGHKKQFYERRELRIIKYGRTLLGKLDFTNDLANCELNQRETGGFCSQYQNVYYHLGLQVNSIQKIHMKWAVDVIPPAISRQMNCKVSEPEDINQSIKLPKYSRM